MKKRLKLLAVLFLVTFVMTSCKDDDDDDDDSSDTRFVTELVGADDEEIIKDTKTNLNWVNDTRACFAGIVIPENQCDDLMFAGQSDWRVPTPTELSELITEINNRSMQLNYINSSCTMMSTSMPVWVMTENSNNPGQTTTAQPGNAGLRCVRNN